MMTRLIKFTILMQIICLFFLGCTQLDSFASAYMEPDPAETVMQTEIPTPSPTLLELSVTPIPTRIPSPTPTVTPEITPEPTDTPAPTPTEEPTPEPAPTPFSVVWMTDTQILTREYPEVFYAMRDWILREKESRNIVFVIHTGDVVDGYSEKMYAIANEALVPIFESIPGMVVSGNHDVSENKSRHNRFTSQPYAKAVQKEGQTYEDGLAAYTTFEAGGETFLVLGIGFNVRGKVVQWVSDVIKEHPDATVIYAIHHTIYPNGSLSPQGKDYMKTSIPETPKARLMLTGHLRGNLIRTDWFDDDGDGEKERSFTTMMFNYQDDVKNGLGFLRILTFYPEDRHIEVNTYSPWYDSWEYAKSKEGEDSFALLNAY